MTLSSRPGQHVTLCLWVGVDRGYSVERVVVWLVVILLLHYNKCCQAKQQTFTFLAENVSDVISKPASMETYFCLQFVVAKALLGGCYALLVS